MWPCDAGLEVEACYLCELDLDAVVTVEDAAQWRRDLALREDPRGDLVEQGLEEMVVVPVHERHPDRSAAQPSRCEQTTEASPDDQDSMGIRRHGLPVELRAR